MPSRTTPQRAIDSHDMTEAMSPTTEGKHVEATTKGDKMGLLDLPAEIWSKIGKFAIDAGPLVDKEALLDSMKNKTARSWHQPAIAIACRCLREELLPYFYKNMVELAFTWHDVITQSRSTRRSRRADNCGQCLRAIGSSNRRSMRNVSLQSYVYNKNILERTASRH